MLRRIVFLVALLLVALPARALAASPAAPCGTTPGLTCSEIDVPLDWTGQTPGTVTLHVERLPASGFERGVMFLIAGGPGQGSASAYGLQNPVSAAFLRSILPGYTLVAYDDRGTGSSGVLRCTSLQKSFDSSAEQGAALASECAAAIGPTRRFYSTRDHAEDLEAVRRSIGVDKVGLFGVSYGTKLALAYALGHPDHVERLLLDSVLPVSFPDPYERNVLQALPGTLADFCPGSSCRAATPDYAGDVVTLANRLAANPIHGRIAVAHGRTRVVRVTGEDLLSAVIESDLNPGTSAELPAAVHAALAGYIRPLLRVAYLTEAGSVEPVGSISSGLYAATTCDDGLFPWRPDTPISERGALLEAAIAALPPGALGPFGTWAARTGSATFCRLWPSPSGGAPVGAGPLPDVPVLAIAGGSDLRTPAASAAAVARMFPQGHLLVVPGVGHSVVTADLTQCAASTVRSWLAGGPVLSQCPRVPRIVAPLGPFPRRVAARSPGATAAAAAATVHEAEAAWLAIQGANGAVTGLYGGRVVSRGLTIRLERYSLVPGLTVSGTLSVIRGHLPVRFAGPLTVGGRAAVPGRLRSSGTSISGVLGGRHVSHAIR